MNGKSMIGALLGAAGGAAMGWGITSIVTGVGTGICVGSSFEACGVSTAHIGGIVGGTLLFMVAAFLSPIAWFAGPVVGLAVAAVIALGSGAELTGSSLGYSAFIALCVLAGPIVLAVILLRSRGKQKLAQELMATGQKGAARVMMARQTGVYINERPQLEVTYSVTPLAGGQPFQHTKKQLLDYGSIQPQPGLTWPCWFDAADPTKVAVGTPSGYTPETLQLLNEFGIPVQQAFGYDPGGSITIPDPQSAGQPGFGQPPPPSAGF